MKTINLIKNATSIETVNQIVTVAGTTFSMSAKSLKRIGEAAQTKIAELTPKIEIVKTVAKKKVVSKKKPKKAMKIAA